jgi:hypothetical protein
MPQLHNLAYISRNAIHGTPDEVKNEIRAILATARKNNPGNGITGALLYSGGYFCQVIEGPQSVIKKLFENIEADTRHKDVVVLHFVPIQSRAFSEWAMAFAGFEEDIGFKIDGVLSSKNELKMKEAGRNLVAILEKLVIEHQKTLEKFERSQI